MNKHSHHTLHSLVPVYAALTRIVKLSVDGFRDGRVDQFVDIRQEAERGMSDLVMLEADLVNDTKGRRAYERGK